MADFTADY